MEKFIILAAYLSEKKIYGQEYEVFVVIWLVVQEKSYLLTCFASIFMHSHFHSFIYKTVCKIYSVPKTMKIKYLMPDLQKLVVSLVLAMTPINTFLCWLCRMIRKIRKFYAVRVQKGHDFMRCGCWPWLWDRNNKIFREFLFFSNYLPWL
jgi:hypothetical protein